ncbi:UbiA family prenyltransferase [Pseudogemmobacter sp. W21_MBD1_M6]|uniref:UbiA family prenyltransferase n=1 Tax=Pseudogemmobacter sp. W21_MBD1_M6 TaxID=3240271 RepID=UPI003F96A497
MGNIKPLVLDVDGTFLKTDILLECFWSGMGKDPVAVVSASARYLLHPERLKARLAQIAPLRTDLLPVNPEIKALADRSRAAGRDVVLASASDVSVVKQLAADHHLGGRVFASDGVTNLKGGAKADALVAAYGENGFDYAGNAPVDRAVWEHAENVLIVGRHDAIARDLTAKGKSVTEFAGGWKMRDLIRAIRPHQWVKNILLLMPMIAAHNFQMSTLLTVIQGIMAFSAAASCIYLINDLVDLEADRLHSTKRNRPFASGAVPLGVGMAACAGLGFFALGVAAWLNPAFLGVVLIYMMLSLAYSLKLKRMRWVDIATLAMLYTLRVVAGAAAGSVSASVFMLIFIFPVFIALGCVKRLTELTLATSDERLPGRGYGRPDRSDLLNVAGLGIVGALLIFFLYTFSAQARMLYPSQWLLWVAMIPMAIWLTRMVWLGYTGKQDYDPIVFAMKDKMGIGILMITLSLMFYAAGIWQQWFGF